MLIDTNKQRLKEVAMAEITINNTKLSVDEGEYILDIARKNGIFIPAICYLAKCSPTLACKLCMVEIDGKRAYSCNTKAKDGMNITTSTKEIELERKTIMKSYCVNHPLECGVCDKSGECELQDYTHLFEVDNQDLFIEDSLKTLDYWAHVKYDPNLCILCERCVTTCKDNLGESNIKVVKKDLPALDGNYWKEKMPKDAFSVWNRQQKGVIGFVGQNDCIDCAECVSVCPVGALGVREFQYSTNAWELHKTSTTCNLCPSGCKIIYESKINACGEREIYRVTNDFLFNTICGAGRFSYDIKANMESGNLDSTIEVIKNAKNIIVGGNTTNNEARFLLALREKFNINLVNPTLKNYSNFIATLNTNLAKLEDIAKHKVILTLGSTIKYENPLVRYKINNALKMQKDSTLIYMHPIKDKLIETFNKNTLSINYKPNREDIMALALLNALDSNNPLLKNLVKIELEIKNTKKVIEKIKEEKEIEKSVEKEIEAIEKKEYFELFLDSAIPYEEYKNLELSLSKAKPLIIIGSDVYLNKNSKFIAKILKSLAQNDKIDILLLPPTPNANGLILQIDFDNKSEGFSIGFRESGDFTFDSKQANFKIPFFSQLNDNITNINFKILPLESAFREESSNSNYLEVLSKKLDLNFKPTNLVLNNDFSLAGDDIRGKYDNLKIKESKEEINFIKDIDSSFNAYLEDFGVHFYPYTKYSSNFKANIGIYVSANKLSSLNSKFGISENDKIYLYNDKAEINANIYIDKEREDDLFMISPQIDNAINLFNNSKYCNVKVRK